jgi:hypothetical protein
MPERILPGLAAYLWDLRSQCEAQVRALTAAQRQVDTIRDGRDPKAKAEAVVQLQQDLQRVVKANAEIRVALQETVEQAGRLGAFYGLNQGQGK